MYNPFIPASRTTSPPPPPPTEAPFAETILPAIIGIVLAVLLVLAVATVLVTRYLKPPCYRGRSLSLPSVEFDVEEILAALELEKRSGERREQSALMDRNIIEGESDKVIAVTGSIPSRKKAVAKSCGEIPEKPKRQHVNNPGKSQKDGVVERNTRKESKKISRKEKTHQETITDDNNSINEGHPNDNNLPSTSQIQDESYGDALDKIRKCNFPKVLPDFPMEHIDYEGNSTHEKRMVNRPPPTLESLTRKITPPSPPKVPVIFTASKDKSRNVVPNFLSLHTNLSASDKKNTDLSGTEQALSLRAYDKKVQRKNDGAQTQTSGKSAASVENKKHQKKKSNKQNEIIIDGTEAEVTPKEDFHSTEMNSSQEKSVELMEESSDEVYPQETDDEINRNGVEDEGKEGSIDVPDCPNVSENIASVVKYLAEQEKLDEAIAIAEACIKESIEIKSNDASEISEGVRLSEAAHDPTKVETGSDAQSTFQSDSDCMTTKEYVPDLSVDSSKKNILRHIINEFERKTTDQCKAETTNSEDNIQTKPLRLSVKQQQFCRKLEKILQSQVPPHEHPELSKTDIHTKAKKDYSKELKQEIKAESNELNFSQENIEDTKALENEKLTILSTETGDCNNQDGISHENVDISKEQMTPTESLVEEVQGTDTPKLYGFGATSAIDLAEEENIEEISHSESVRIQDENELSDFSACLSKGRGIKKAASEGTNKVSKKTYIVRKCKSSEDAGIRENDMGSRIISENVSKSSSDEDKSIGNNGKILIDKYPSSGELSTQNLSIDDSSEESEENKDKNILISTENDGQTTGSMASQRVLSQERTSSSPNENASKKCVISSLDELTSRRLSLRELNTNSTSGLIDRPRSEVGKQHESKNEVNTIWPQGRKTSSV